MYECSDFTTSVYDFTTSVYDSNHFVFPTIPKWKGKWHNYQSTWKFLTRAYKESTTVIMSKSHLKLSTLLERVQWLFCEKFQLSVKQRKMYAQCYKTCAKMTGDGKRLLRCVHKLVNTVHWVHKFANTVHFQFLLLGLRVINRNI